MNARHFISQFTTTYVWGLIFQWKIAMRWPFYSGSSKYLLLMRKILLKTKKNWKRNVVVFVIHTNYAVEQELIEHKRFSMWRYSVNNFLCFQNRLECFAVQRENFLFSFRYEKSEFINLLFVFANRFPKTHFQHAHLIWCVTSWTHIAHLG